MWKSIKELNKSLLIVSHLRESCLSFFVYLFIFLYRKINLVISEGMFGICFLTVFPFSLILIAISWRHWMQLLSRTLLCSWRLVLGKLLLQSCFCEAMPILLESLLLSMLFSWFQQLFWSNRLEQTVVSYGFLLVLSFLSLIKMKNLFFLFLFSSSPPILSIFSMIFRYCH